MNSCALPNMKIKLDSSRPHLVPASRWLRHVSLTIVSLVLSIELNAHPPAIGQPGGHNHLEYLDISSTYTMADVDDSTWIQVTWKVLRPAGGVGARHNYLVTILSDAPINKTYSLLTLGFQSWEHPKKIVAFNAHTGTVGIIPKKGDTATALTATAQQPLQVHIPKNGDEISMFVLANSSRFEFEVELEAGHPVRPNTIWRDKSKTVAEKTKTKKALVDGHDNNPPKNPPD